MCEYRMKEKLKKLLQFIFNPRFILSFGIAWMITNGWSYVLFGLGSYFQNTLMLAISGAYLSFLWLPVSPEKLATLAIAIVILKKLFPNDEKTLLVLKNLRQKTHSLIDRKRKERKNRKLGDKNV